MPDLLQPLRSLILEPNMPDYCDIPMKEEYYPEMRKIKKWE